MKIGVITYWNSKDNYGQLLQCYALQQYLRSLGHDPFLIRYCEPFRPTPPFRFRWGKLFLYITKIPRYLSNYFDNRRKRHDKIKYEKQADFDKRNFTFFLTSKINCTEIYTYETIKNTPPQADAFICGSDQIWGGNEDVYFLSFAPDSALKIAYAPSMGGVSYSEGTRERLKKYLDRFNLIGMREQSGVDECTRMGYNNTVKVIDPTLLLQASEYKDIAQNPSINKPYAFVYLLGNSIGFSIKQIERYVNSQKLEMVYVASQGRYDEHTKIDPTIEEWLGWVSNADLVITNSFHCIVFSLLFHRNFISIPLIGRYARMNTRIEELLSECGLTHRIAYDELPEENMHNKDYDLFENYRMVQCTFSEDFLRVLKN